LDLQSSCHNHRICFEKPNLRQLTRQYTVVDLHFHSRYSDGFNAIPEIARRAAKLGIGVAVTDHNEIGGAVELDRYKEVLSIPGIEVTSYEGTHVLVYFYDIDDLKRFYAVDVRPFMGQEVMNSTALQMEEIVERARNYRSLVIFPHPECPVYIGICNPYFPPKRLQPLLASADGVEVINSGNLNKSNLKCALLGFNLDKAITAGSDGHLLHHMGRSVAYAECGPDREAFLEAIRLKQNKVVGKEFNLLRKVASNGYKFTLNMRNYSDLLEKNMRYGRHVFHSKSQALRDNIRRNVNGKFRYPL
jgi:predicted metal-dependent phosphoesterase TrpH